MHGAEKPVVGDLVFDTPPSARVGGDEEDPEMTIDAIEDDVQLGEKAGPEDAGMSLVLAESVRSKQYV